MGLWLKKSAARRPFGRPRSIGKYDIKCTKRIRIGGGGLN